ncbi:MAG: hypothetical protein PVJ04_06135 [Gemmatimonadota bacterium]|jgi:hypothetical protein
MALHSRTVLGVVSAFFLAACASGGSASGQDETRGVVPDLRGRTVLVLPTQLRDRVPNGVTIDEEVAYALGARSDAIDWVFPEEVESILRRSPGIQAHTRSLPVEMFLQAEVKRVGDPLYGEIRRLTTLAGADIAIIPVLLRYGDDGAYHMVATLLEPVTGRVLWFATVDGAAGAPEEPGPLASVADALAKAVAWGR